MGASRRPEHTGSEQQDVTIVAEGPATAGVDGLPLTTRARIPVERTLPGPVGARLEVVVRDGAGYRLAADLTGGTGWAVWDRTPRDTAATVLDDPAFLAQHVYAVASETLSTFERTLGRRIGWSGGRRLRIEADADIPAGQTGYQNDECVINLGRQDGVPLALYRDLLVHEVTHAVLAGYRPRWSDRWAMLDQFSLHEALADLMALLSVFASEEVVQRLVDSALQRGGTADAAGADRLDTAILRSGLFGLADHLFGRGHVLRSPMAAPPPSGWRTSPEPHWRAAGIVHAVMEAVLRLWNERLDVPGGRSNVYLVAGAGAEVGTHVRRMLVRGLAYMPPVDAGPEDLLRGMLAADETIVPDDPRGYRRTLAECFADVGVTAGDASSLSGTEDLGQLEYAFGNGMLDAGPEEIVRFVWNNSTLMAALGLDPSRGLAIDAVRTSTRISPSGFAVTETGASLVQDFVAGTAEARALGLATDAPVGLRGGALLRFDDGGRLVFAAIKPVLDIARQQAKLEELRCERPTASEDLDSSGFRERMLAIHARRWGTVRR